MTRTVVWLAILAGMFAGQAVRADGQWYAGASLGSAEANKIGFEDIDDGSALSGSLDNNDFGWKIFGGYSYNRYVAIEASYADLGEIRLNARSDGNGSIYDTGDVIARIDAQGFTLSAVGAMPVNDRLDALAKVGYFVWKSTTSLSNGAFGTLSQDDDGSGPMIGIGARYRFSDRMTFLGEYEHFSDIHGDDGSLLSLGISFTF